MISRRSFLLGVSSLVTDAFVARASSYARVHGRPMLLPQPVAENGSGQILLFVDEVLDEPSETSGRWRVSLGEPWRQDPPEPLTWRSYLNLQGYPMRNALEVQHACRCCGISADALDSPLSDEFWCSVWEYALSPQAKAYTFISQAEFTCGLTDRSARSGRILFVDGGWHPGSSERWVELEDDLSVSLLQARFLERNSPVRLVFDGDEGSSPS